MTTSSSTITESAASFVGALLLGSSSGSSNYSNSNNSDSSDSSSSDNSSSGGLTQPQQPSAAQLQLNRDQELTPDTVEDLLAAVEASIANEERAISQLVRDNIDEFFDTSETLALVDREIKAQGAQLDSMETEILEQPNGTLPALLNILSELADHERQYEEHTAILQVLQLLDEFANDIAKLDHAASDAEVASTSVSMEEVNLLSVLSDRLAQSTVLHGTAIHTALDAKLAQHRDLLIKRLTSAVANVVHVKYMSISIPSGNQTASNLAAHLDVAKIIGCDSQIMQQLQNDLYQHVFDHLIKSNNAWSVRESGDALAFDDIGSVIAPSVSERMQHLQSTVDFIAKRIIPQHHQHQQQQSTHELNDIVGAHQLASSIIHHVLKPLIPANRSGFHAFEELAAHAVSLESHLAELGVGSGQISDFVRSVHSAYAERRRNELLSTARRLITNVNKTNAIVADHGSVAPLPASIDDIRQLIGSSSLQNSNTVDGDGISAQLVERASNYFDALAATQSQPRQLGKFACSSAAAEIVQNAYFAVNDAMFLPESSASLLITGALSSIELYHTLRRTALRLHNGTRLTELSSASVSDPTIASMSFNDTVLLTAHASLLESITSADGQQSQSHQHLGRIETANHALAQHINFHRTAILSVLDEMDGLRDSANKRRKPVIEQSIKKAIGLIENVSHTWHQLLSAHVACRSSGILYSAIVDYMVNETLELIDIAVDESQELSKLFQLVLDAKGDIIPTESLMALSGARDAGLSTDKAAKSQNNDDGDDDEDEDTPLDGDYDDDTFMAMYVPHLFKFRQLQVILSLTMAEIMDRYKAGHLTDFTSDELVCLIQALFSDTPLRTNNINTIRESTHSR
ncbi:hypothetical protein GQ42DRAFT_164156 [Ramicandelaber brevisporus]|nr:hypothetical protein GQ42DRAFT_164156 [Ramicandelaber brevisporus]